MKHYLKTLPLTGFLLLAGCFSMDIATTDALKGSSLSSEDGKVLEHVVVSNYGWYLFNWIPLACGNATPGAFFPWKIFSGQVKPDLLHDRLMMHAAAQNADVKDLSFIRNEKVCFDLPGTNFPVPIPYILCYREIQFSGVLMQHKNPEPSSEAKQRKAVEEMNQLLNKLSPEEEK